MLHCCNFPCNFWISKHRSYKRWHPRSTESCKLWPFKKKLGNWRYVSSIHEHTEKNIQIKEMVCADVMSLTNSNNCQLKRLPPLRSLKEEKLSHGIPLFASSEVPCIFTRCFFYTYKNDSAGEQNRISADQVYKLVHRAQRCLTS